MKTIPQNHVRVYQSGNRTWGWCKEVNGCGRHATELFGSELEAAQAAAVVAKCSRLPLHVSDTMQRLLVAHWYTNGWHKAANGKGRDLCANQYERKGFDERQAAYMDALFAEADAKPRPEGSRGGDFWDVAPVYAELEAVA